MKYSILDLKKSIDLAMIDFFKENQQLTSDILTKVVIQNIDKFQNKLNIGLQDSITDLLDQFKKDIQEEIFKSATCNNFERDKILFPKNCRFIYSKGNTDIIILEQEPCLRNLILENTLIKQSENKNTTRVALLIPYSIFIFQWQNKKLINTYTVWRKEPLTSLKDIVYHPLLPNIHKNYSICLGNILNPFESNQEVNVVCNNVISNFWQSVFNNDLSHFWWSKSSLDKIKDVETWSKNSSDPFLFQDVNLPTNYKTLESLIDFCLINEKETDAVLLRQELGKKIDLCLDQMFNKLMKYFKKHKFEKFYPKDIENSLALSINSITTEICDILKIMQNELDNLSEPKQVIVKNKSFWKPYKLEKNE